MFSERLKSLRESQKLSQTELASILGVTKQTISNWENNNIAPSIEMVLKIANYFNVTTDYLLARTDDILLVVTDLNKEHIAHIQSIITDFRIINAKNNFK